MGYLRRVVLWHKAAHGLRRQQAVPIALNIVKVSNEAVNGLVWEDAS